jgi:hypothetical protein
VLSVLQLIFHQLIFTLDKLSKMAPSPTIEEMTRCLCRLLLLAVIVTSLLLTSSVDAAPTAGPSCDQQMLASLCNACPVNRKTCVLQVDRCEWECQPGNTLRIVLGTQ